MVSKLLARRLATPSARSCRRCIAFALTLAGAELLDV